MVKYLSPNVRQRIAYCIVAVMACSAARGLSAQELVDPMRPPAGLAFGDVAPAAEIGPVLQSVIISQRRAEAIISGRTVKVGDKIGEATIVKIVEGEVVLREGKDLRALKLFPNIEKRTESLRSGNKVEKRQQ